MSVQRLGVREVGQDEPRTAAVAHLPVAQPAVGTHAQASEIVLDAERAQQAQRLQAMAKIQQTLYVLASVVGARLLLLLGLGGAFALGFMAMNRQSPEAIVILAVYCAFVILPFVYLYTKRPV